MSNFILPPGLVLPRPMQLAEEPTDDASAEQKATSIPTPTGWKILCVVPDVVDTYENSSIVKAEASMRTEEHATTVLFVVKVGPDAYKDAAKFPAGAWCKEGDFVLVRAYSGTRFKIYGKEFRLLNDDQVDAVVQDPRGLSRA